jgi:hypothetical protein
MFGKRKSGSELSPPPLANTNAEATEVMRIWTAPGEGPHVVLRTTWEDPAAWGVLLVDVARHAANAYAKALFDAEWNTPTDEAREIKPQ